MSEKAEDATLNEQVLRASDIRETVGLSYRQLNDWESKGVLPSKKRSKAGWRKFTPRELFVLMVCKEIRDKFGVPLEKLSFIKSVMLKSEANDAQDAVDLMNNYGMTIYLLTDLKETFIMDTDAEIEDLFRMGMFRGSDEQGYLLIKINPLINKLLSFKGVGPIDTSDEVYDLMRKTKQQATANNRQEQKVLKLIREKKYKQVTIHLKDGEIIRASTEEELSEKKRDKPDKELLAIIKDQEYQSISLKVHDGKIVRLKRTTPIKLDTGTEKSWPICLDY